MINRVLIRLKVVQMVYAFYQGGSKDLVKSEKELLHSLKISYDLYHMLLFLIISVTRYAEERIQIGREKYLPTEEEKNPNCKFINNSLVKALEMDEDFISYCNNNALNWDLDRELIKSLYECIIKTDFYEEYMNSEVLSFDEDKEIWRKIFKRVVPNIEILFETLEEKNIYWNSDFDIVNTFVIKTIKRFKENSEEKVILPMFKSLSDKAFAVTLFRNAIINEKEYRDHIQAALKNWEIERLAVLDLLIIQVALSELLEIKDVPIKVTMDNYISISKFYSTQKSKSFVNGLLESLVKVYKSENRLALK